MPQREQVALLKAIEDFRAAYAGNPEFSKVIESLTGIESSIEKVSQGEQAETRGPERDTPGARAATQGREESPFGGPPSDEDRQAARETDGPVKDKARALLDRMKQSKSSDSEESKQPPARSEDSGKQEEGDRSADIPEFLRKAADKGGDARESDRKKKKRYAFTARR